MADKSIKSRSSTLVWLLRSLTPHGLSGTKLNMAKSGLHQLVCVVAKMWKVDVRRRGSTEDMYFR